MAPKSQVQEKEEVCQTRISKTSWEAGDTNLTRIKVAVVVMAARMTLDQEQ